MIVLPSCHEASSQSVAAILNLEASALLLGYHDGPLLRRRSQGQISVPSFDLASDQNMEQKFLKTIADTCQFLGTAFMLTFVQLLKIVLKHLIHNLKMGPSVLNF